METLRKNEKLWKNEKCRNKLILLEQILKIVQTNVTFIEQMCKTCGRIVETNVEIRGENNGEVCLKFVGHLWKQSGKCGNF